MLFILLAYLFFSDWKALVLYWIAIPLILQVVTFLWIYESPKFLIMKKNFKVAKKTIDNIAKTNKKNIPNFTLKEQKEYEQEIKVNLIEKVKEITCDDFLSRKTHRKSSENSSVSIENPDPDVQKNINCRMNEIIKNHIDHNDLFLFHKFPRFRQQLEHHHKVYTLLDLFKYPSQLRHTLILCLVSFSIYLTYFGLIFSLETIGGNVYISAFVQTSAELFAYIVINFTIKFLKRRLALSLCLLAQSLACLLTLVLHRETQILVLATVSRFCVAMALGIVTVYSAEVYPTTVRSLGIGLTSFVGKFGCSLAPLIGTIFQYTLMLHPMVSYGVVGGLAVIAGFWMKETQGLTLAEDIPEVFVKKSLIKNRESNRF